MKALAILGLLAFCVLTTGCGKPDRDALPGFPRLMLWAWERPEDLRFIDPMKVGVAYLAGTVSLRGDQVGWHPRMQPLRIPPGTKLMAVVRVESGSPSIGKAAGGARWAAEVVSQASGNAGVSALQIDFDARYGERGFYGELVRNVRDEIPRKMPLTITALVSWCASDTWIAHLPIQAAVPMFFRMGSEKLMRHAQIRLSLCQGNTGISTDELIPVKLGNRVFLFNPQPWTQDGLQAALHEVNRWP